MDVQAKKKLVEMANAWDEDVVNAGRLRLTLEEHDVVVGVWQQTDGDVGHLIIKGEPTLRSIGKDDFDVTLCVTAIPFVDSEEAAAAREVFGDFRRM